MSQITTSFWWMRYTPVAHRGPIYYQGLSCGCSETPLFAGLAENCGAAEMWVTTC